MTNRTLSAVAYPVFALRDQLGAAWPHITASREKTERMMARLRRELNQPRLIPSDTRLVVFGSLARRELTDGSDVDWTLLVDGPRTRTTRTPRSALPAACARWSRRRPRRVARSAA